MYSIILAPGKPGSAMASLAKAGVAGANPVQVVLQDSPIFLAQVWELMGLTIFKIIFY